MPTNSIVAIKIFRSIALGEFIDSKWLTDPIKEKMQSSFDEDTKANVLSNMGIMLLFALALVFVIIPVFIVIKLCPPGKIRSIFEKLKVKLMWNSVIRYVLQSYLKISIVCLMAFPVLSLDNTKSKINTVISITLLTFLVLSPFIFQCILYKKRRTLNDEAVKKKFGSLYLGIRTSSASEFAYSMVFLIRRLLYSVITVSCLQNPNICIHVFLLTNVLYIDYLGYSRPHDTRNSYKIEIMNEVGL